jgi:PTS system nitrogen regulatory IIA component
MKLSDIVSPKKINLSLKSRTKEQVLRELVDIMRLSPPARETLVATLLAREELGSTGVGRGIAIPHCRSLVVSRLRVAIGRSKAGIAFKSTDRRRAKLFFLVVAPPVGDPAEYLIVLGQIAQVSKKLSSDRRVSRLKKPEELIALIKELEE